MSESRLHLRLISNAEAAVRRGHPWVFSDSIRDQNREGCAGEMAIIFDRNNHFLAIGLYDPDSPLRVRVLHTGKPLKIDDTWWERNLDSAIQKRHLIFDAQTNGGRYINGESDAWPGLVMDRYAETLVLKLYTRAWFPHLERVVALIRRNLKPASIVLRLSRNILEAAPTGFSDGKVISGKPISEPVIFRENGLLFEADVINGQKTGFFLDQRDNRREVGKLSLGRDVLNCFSFSGGFSLSAARGGARSVTDVDLSAHALASAERNFSLNRSLWSEMACAHQVIQADVFAWLKNPPSRKFGLIVLDPPSLARREKERGAAIEAYQSLARRAMALLQPGGILVASSCSAHVSAQEFFEAIRKSVAEQNAGVSEIQTTGHPADHPATFKEAKYLKTIYFALVRERVLPIRT